MSFIIPESVLNGYRGSRRGRRRGIADSAETAVIFQLGTVDGRRRRG